MKKILALCCFLLLLPSCVFSSNDVNRNPLLGDVANLDQLTEQITGRITIQESLREGDDSLTFHFDYTFMEQSTIDVVLTIEDAMGSNVQQLELYIDPDTIDRPYAENLEQFADNVTFMDINFDGYLDFTCIYTHGNNGRSTIRRGWVWNPETGLFEQTNLDEICNFYIQESDQSIRGGFSGAGGGTTSIYQFINGAFVETNRLEYSNFPPYDLDTGELISNFYWSEPGADFPTHFHEYELINGTMVEVWPELICDTEEGIVLVGEHLHGPNSIWFPQQP